MRIISRYIFNEISHYFLVLLAMMAVVFLINETYDTREDFLEHAPSALTIAQFLVYSIPHQLGQTFPMLALLSTIFAYGLLAKNRELLAMAATGMSFWRLALPALIFGLLLTGFSYWFSEAVVPTAQRRARYLEKVKIGGRSESIFTKQNDLFVKGGGNRLYLMDKYLSEQNRMKFPTILELRGEDRGLSERIEAVEGRLVEVREDGTQLWEFTGAERWTFGAHGAVETYQQYDKPYQIQMEEELEKFLARSKKPEWMGVAELLDYRNLLLRKGSEEVRQYSVALHMKLSMPLACLMLSLIGFAVVADVHARHFARGVSLGLLLAIGYFLLLAFFKGLGEQGTLPPWLVGWPVIALYLGLAVWLVGRLERLRS